LCIGQDRGGFNRGKRIARSTVGGGVVSAGSHDHAAFDAALVGNAVTIVVEAFALVGRRGQCLAHAWPPGSTGTGLRTHVAGANERVAWRGTATLVQLVAERRQIDGHGDIHAKENVRTDIGQRGNVARQIDRVNDRVDGRIRP
jgi:hypothetical protein